jgi:tropinone reductase I
MESEHTSPPVCKRFLLLLVWTATAAGSDSGLWSLTGRSAVVTGGSKGLGRAIVEELLDQGCTVLTCARDISPLAELLRASDGRCIAIEADVSTVAGRELLIAEVEARFGERGLHVLVNNVGTNLRKPSTAYSDEEYEMLHATNQASAFHLSRRCHGALKRAGGCIVSVSSVSGSSNDATGAVYHMTKAAMEHMTRYLACEWGADGIRVNAVAPWFIKTPLTEPLLAHEPFHAAVRAATPLRRVGEPHEVACTVAFLAMDAAAYITGQVVGIDGGMMQVGFKYTGE